MPDEKVSITRSTDLTQLSEQTISDYAASLRVEELDVEKMTPEQKDHYEMQTLLQAYLTMLDSGIYDIVSPTTLEMIVNKQVKKR